MKRWLWALIAVSLVIPVGVMGQFLNPKDSAENWYCIYDYTLSVANPSATIMAIRPTDESLFKVPGGTAFIPQTLIEAWRDADDDPADNNFIIGKSRALYVWHDESSPVDFRVSFWNNSKYTRSAATVSIQPYVITQFPAEFDSAKFQLITATTIEFAYFIY